MKMLSLAAIFFPVLVITSEFPTGDGFVRPEVIAEVMDFFQWRESTIVYDSSLSLKSKHLLLALLVDRHIGITMIDISTSSNDVISTMMSTIQNSSISTILLYTWPNAAKDFLRQPKYQWLIIDLGEDNLASLEQILCCSPCNVALVTPVSPTAWDFMSWMELPPRMVLSQNNNSNQSSLPGSSAGHSSFAIYSYDIYSRRLHLIGSWSAGVRLIAYYDVIFLNPFSQFHNSTLGIGAWQSPPFLKRVGNRTYVGFCIDILDEMALRLNFSYRFVEPEDGLYGVQDDNGTWNGMIGMLIRGELDLAVGPITITPDRLEAVDFTVPYMEDGGGILTRRDTAKPDLMNVFRPFPLFVWIMIVTAIVVTSVCLFLLTKVHRWFVPVTEKEDEECDGGLDTPWTLLECLAVIYGSVVNQGASRHPKTSSGRMVLGCWWVFTILVVSMYTASLAALLTVKLKEDTIDSLQELAASSLVPVILAGSNWRTLFQTTDSNLYRTIRSRMTKAPPIRDSSEGLDLVYAGTGALVHDVNSVRYLYGQDCEKLHVASTIFNGNGVGFAMPKNAYYKKAMNNIILKLQEGGFLEVWKKKWWKMAPECESGTRTFSSAQQLPLLSIVGILIFYAVVIGLALLVHFLHWILQSLPCWEAIQMRLKRNTKSSKKGGGGGSLEDHPDGSEDEGQDQGVSGVRG